MATLVAGCSGNQFPVKPAKGKVVCGGKPVTIGSVSFTPIGEPGKMETGKPATGTLSADGTFVLTTKDRFDGAIVGKHSVRYFGPEDEEEEESSSDEGTAQERAENAERIKERRAQMNSLCVQSGEIIVEVKANNENDFTIELSPPGKQ